MQACSDEIPVQVLLRVPLPGVLADSPTVARYQIVNVVLHPALEWRGVSFACYIARQGEAPQINGWPRMRIFPDSANATVQFIRPWEQVDQ